MEHSPAEEDFRKFERVCRRGGLRLGERQMAQLQDYVNLLLDWNTRVNLISRGSTSSVWTGQILHSLAPWSVLEIPRSCRVLDLGTGGGLPGIPLAILRPDADIVLLDSVRKKCDAVRNIVKTLGLEKVEVICARAEELGHRQGYAGTFRVVIARAVAPLFSLIRWAMPLLDRKGGSPGEAARVLAGPVLVAMKGGSLDDELRRAAQKTGERGIDVLTVPLLEDVEAGLEGKKLVIVRFARGGNA